MMGDLNQYFSRWEFECPGCDCNQHWIDYELVTVLTKVREHFKKPVLIRKNKADTTMHAANRCSKKNKAIGGSETSYHLFGMAVDFHIEGVSVQDVYDYMVKEFPTQYGIIAYEWGLHFDVGKGILGKPRPYHSNKLV